MMYTQRITLAITGASGIQYSMRLLQCLLKARRQVYVIFSKPAQVVAGLETDLNLPAQTGAIEQHLAERYQAGAGQLQVFSQEQWTAPIASGSGVADAMVVCPCSTGTLAAIANGSCDNLIQRAADVSIKEQKKLILLPREMPFSEIHLRNMHSLARIGVVIMPPNPGFYNRPTTMQELIDFVVARVLDQLSIEHELMPRWGLDQQDN